MILDKIHQFLEDKGVEGVQSIVPHPGRRSAYFVFLHIDGVPKNRRLSSAARRRLARDILTTKGISVEFVLADNQSFETEAGVRAIVSAAIAVPSEQVFIVVKEGRATVWIGATPKIEDDKLALMKDLLGKYLSGQGYQLEGLRTALPKEKPGKLVVLKVVRHLAPVRSDELFARLNERGFEVPSTQWVEKRLDALRQAKLLVRLRDGHYALTAQCLSFLGTGKTRSSPDVARLLALAAVGR